MSWILVTSAALFVAGVGLIARAILRRRSIDSLEPVELQSEPLQDRTPVSRQFQVPQFMKTGTRRIAEPRSSISHLRAENVTALEVQDDESNIDILNTFLADVRDSVGADEAVFWRWSEQRSSLGPVGWSTPGTNKPEYFEMQSWSPLVRWSAEARKVNFDADARVAVARLASAPVEHDGQLLGVLSVTRAEGLERGREHLKTWLPRHAAHIGHLWALFELRKDYGRHMRQSQALLKAAERVQGHKSQDALCKAITEIALQVSRGTDAAVVRWRADANRGWVQYLTPSFGLTAPFQIAPESLVAQACAEATTKIMQDRGVSGARVLFTAGDDAFGKGTVVVVPLMLENRVMGAIVAAADRPDAVTKEEAGNVALLGALAAAALEMVWEMEEVSRRARTDALTGLANRGAFDEKLVQMLAHSDRFGHSLSLIMADVDHFKNVNDTLGHDVGDIVLQSVAKTLSDGVRAVDICARFGGEEIAILLPQTTLVGAVDLADRLRKAVAASTIETSGEAIKVTISCGVANYPEGVITKEALFAAADRALYEAKNAGRNCVKAAAPKPVGMV